MHAMTTIRLSASASASTSSAPLPRYHFLDWVRILAFFLLILYHVGMYYVTWGWHVKSPYASDALEPYMMLSAPWRLSLLFLWRQVMREDPPRAPAARTYIVTIGIAQVGWVALALADLPIGTTVLLFIPLYALELGGPRLAERKAATPWHPHHIAERYGLMVIITLGEVILGTVFAVNALVHGEAGWTVDAGLLAFAGVGLAFGCWWAYFVIPWAEPLARHRERGWWFGWGHLVVFAALAAMGAGLHVAAFSLEGEAEIGTTATVLSVTIPLAIYIATTYGLYSVLMRERDPFHLALLAGTAAILVLTVALATAGVDMAICLVVLTLAPAVTVVGYETVGHRHITDALERL